MTDEFDELLDETPPEPLSAAESSEPRVDPGAVIDHLPREMTGALPGQPTPRVPLVTAASLLDPSDDQDQGDFEPGLYKGFEILHEREWPRVERHLHLRRRFYVRHNDAVGMVPWAGSMIIWQWDEAWEQGGYKTEVQSFLKEEKKETKKR